jgi:hypothetical protein
MDQHLGGRHSDKSTPLEQAASLMILCQMDISNVLDAFLADRCDP